MVTDKQIQWSIGWSCHSSRTCMQRNNIQLKKLYEVIYNKI